MSSLPAGGLIHVSETLSIGRLGFGAARILGGQEYRATSRLIETALAVGIRHFDTAPSYGDGQSEALLGDILSGVADVTITTKIGIPRPDMPSGQGFAKSLYRRVGRPLLAKMPGLKTRLLAFRAPSSNTPLVQRRLDRDEVVRELDISTRLLRRTPDIFLLHEPAGLALDDGLRALFDDLLAEGRFQAFGSGAGGLLTPELMFGTVAQGLYSPDLPQAAQVAWICHGILRRPASGMTPAQTFQAAFAGSPAMAFLVSASQPDQLKTLAALL